MVFQRQYFTEAEESIIESVEEDFKTDLINYLTIIKQSSTDDIKEVINKCQELYEPFTKPFFQKWSQSNLLKWHSDYENNYYSFVFTYLDTKIILPHRMLIFEALQPKNTLLEQLNKAKGTKYFFFILNKIQRVLNLPLLTNDIRIIETLINPFLRHRIVAVPTNRQIATLLGCSENTISRRLDQLLNKYIVTTKYRVDLAKLGYQTYAIVHLDNIDQAPLDLEPFCLVDVPIDWGEEIAKLKIFQVPYSRTNILRKIKDYFDSKYEVTLTKSYLGWNLSGLTPSVAKRWKVLPPIFLGESWDDFLLSEGTGIEYNLFNDMTTLRISKNQAKMLDLLQIEAVSKAHLSQTLGLTPKYIQQFYDYFIGHDLISRFSQIGHVGLDNKIWITLIGSPSKSNFSLLSNIVEHLKFFPFSWLFYNEKNFDLNSRPLLAGILWLPSSWFVDFYAVWVHLIDLGFVPKININQGVVKWSIEINNTYNFDS